MRARKNRELNIFSASVVDLFASGLGVFLIVAIIALVNQKKEISSADSAVENSSSTNAVMEKEIADLKSEIKLLKKGQINSKMEMIAKFANESERVEAKTLANENLIAMNKELQQELQKSRDTQVQMQKKINELKISGVAESSPEQFDMKLELGSKIQLPNVQFYAGTDKPIQPYALLEIKGLAKRLLKNPNIAIEVSGHIFLTAKEIKSRKVFDQSNLSGRRAQLVCDELVRLGIDRKRLKCVGYGGKRYLYLTNDQYSEEAQLNRRVEVEVIGD